MVKRRRKRRSGALIAWVSVGVVVALVATFVLIKELSGSNAEATNFPPLSSATFSELTHIPASVYDQVGVSSPIVQVLPPNVFKNQPKLELNGLPGTFYYGAEYCPYCAATRWGIAAALARFGSWHNNTLYKMWSASNDVAPNTPTMSFYRTTYTSPNFSFTGYEVEDRNRNPLMSLPPEINHLVRHYNPGLSFPFMDIGNKVMITGSAFDPNVLQGYKTQSQIAALLDQPNNYITQAIIATANYVSAGLCSIAKDPPASVCNSAGVKAAATALKLRP